MPKLKTYGVITEEEVKQAERDGKFLIVDTVTCSYCQKPVSVDENPKYLYCPQHYQLALSMAMYPGYPAVAKDAPRYKQMHFFLSKLERNRTLFDSEKRHDIAREKGCPFCDRYMSPVEPPREMEKDVSLLNQPMFCPECGVSFRLQVIARTDGEQNLLQMRFTPDAAALSSETTHSDANREPTEIDTRRQPDTLAQETSESSHTQDTDPPLPENSISHLMPSVSESSHGAPRKHPRHRVHSVPYRSEELTVPEKIVDFLTDINADHTATGTQIKNALGGFAPSTFKWAMDQLIKDGIAEKVKYNLYRLRT